MMKRTQLLRLAAATAVAGIALFGGGMDPAGAVPSSTCTETHHSDTGNGANVSGSYDSNCIPAASGNGQGKAQPCAGCVGNADDKNPKGQYPDGSDHTNGYECDGNNGIAKTNPAHTGCTPPSSGS